MFTKLLVVIQIVTPGVAIVKSGTFSVTVRIGVTFSIFVSGWAEVVIEEVIYLTTKAHPVSEVFQEVKFTENVTFHYPVVILIISCIALVIGKRVLRVT